MKAQTMNAAETEMTLFENLMPDPFVFAVLLTFAGALLAWWLAPAATPASIASAWYAGIFNLFTFAFQMVIMLVAGYALATAPPVLVAAAYTGFVISTEGLSGSIALSQATHGSALNIVEKVTGQGLPLSSTVFTKFNLIPIAVLFVILPIIFRYLAPTPANTVYADPDRLRAEDQQKPVLEAADTFGARLDHAWILNLGLVLFGIFALVLEFKRTHGAVDLNSVIIILLLLGLLLHWRPAAYVAAVRHAARISGPLVLQYPLYGGLMGIITTTGLAAVISKVFIKYSTAHTLPFFTYLTSLVITLFVPSGGGHWAVQGPFAVPAARDLHASYAGTTMAVAMGESVANMLQPFFALPILAIAGIKMRRMMGFMVVTFLVSFIVFGASLLFLVPAGQ